MSSRISRKDSKIHNKGTTLIKMVLMVSKMPIFIEALKLFLKNSCLYNATCSCVQLVWSTPLVFVLGIEIWLQVFCRKCNHRRHCLRKDLLYLSRLDHVKTVNMRGRRKKGREGEEEKSAKGNRERSLTLSPQFPFLFPFFPIPYPFGCLLRRLKTVHSIVAAWVCQFNVLVF